MSIKKFNKNVTDNTVTSILHPKRYLRQRAEERAKLPPAKPYVPTSGPDKWIADAQNYLKSGYKVIEDYSNEQQQQRKKNGLRYYENGESHAGNTTKPVSKTTQPTEKPKTQKTTTPTKQSVPIVKTTQPTQKTTTPTKQSTTVNNQKTTVKPKEEVKTTPKQTYLKPKEPKGEVNVKIKLFQKMLLDEGLDLGKEGADGIWGKNTQEAFEKLQANKANYAIAMEKFKQLDEELQPKTIEGPSPFTTRAPFQMNNAIRPEAMPAFPTPESAYMNQNSQQSNDSKSLLQQLNENRIKETMKTPHSYLKKGGIMKPKKKKCSCGCAMKISKNAKGGLIESCACGCSMKHINKGEKGTLLSYNKKTDTYNGRYKNIDLPYEQADLENSPGEFTVTAKKPLSAFEKWKKDKANKPRIIPTPKVGVTVNKNQKGGKVTTNDSIQAHNRLNASESESGKGPQTKQEVINRLRKGNFGPGNTKAGFDKELKNKK